MHWGVGWDIPTFSSLITLLHLSPSTFTFVFVFLTPSYSFFLCSASKLSFHILFCAHTDSPDTGLLYAAETEIHGIYLTEKLAADTWFCTFTFSLLSPGEYTFACTCPSIDVGPFCFLSPLFSCSLYSVRLLFVVCYRSRCSNGHKCDQSHMFLWLSLVTCWACVWFVNVFMWVCFQGSEALFFMFFQWDEVGMIGMKPRSIWSSPALISTCFVNTHTHTNCFMHY